MTKTNRHIIGLLLLSSLIAALLFNLRSVVYLFNGLGEHAAADTQNAVMIKMHVSLLTLGFQILLFFVIAVFNYQWAGTLLPARWPGSLKWLLVLLINLLLYYGFAWLEPKIILQWLASSHSLAGHGLEQQMVYQKILTGITHETRRVYFLYANLPIALLAVAEAYFIILIRKIKSAELENVRLREEKSNAELAALKEQISPHFFFNTLNSLSAVIRTEKKADSLDFVEKMSEVYRYILDSAANDTVTLADELAFINAYAHLLKKRFGDQLQIRMDIESDALNGLLPPMALQTLIENVVKHNTLSGDAPIIVTVEYRDGFLYVKNNMIPRKTSEGHGVGLANLNRRCQMIVGKDIEIVRGISDFAVKIPVLTS